MSSCRTGYHFAEAYVAAAREQQGAQPIPSRMPTENEVTTLLNSLIMALKKLEEVRDMVQQNRIQTERARDSSGSSGRKQHDDEDVSMYGDGIKPAYAINEVKKRRGVSFGLFCALETHKKQDADMHPLLASGSSRAVPQLQPHRHARVAARPRWREDPLQRLRPALRQARAQAPARPAVAPPETHR
jgi:hypothetical protein